MSSLDETRVEGRIRQLEASSSIELVVAVIERSGDYWQWRVAIAGCWALAAALALHHWGAALLWAVLLEIPVGLLSYAVLGLSPLRRQLIPPRAGEQAVRARAFQLFSERGLYRTRDHTGLLILVSALERRVFILGDSALHERVGENGWQEQVAHLIAQIREGRTADGIIEVIDAVESKLASSLPARSDDTDELPNTVIVG